MKAIVTFTAGLMIVSATFAQSSRRSEVKENNNESNNSRRTESVNTERRTPTESSRSSRTESYSSGRSSSSNNNSAARTPEVSTKQGQQTVSESSRSSRSSSSETRSASVNSNKGVSSRSNNGYQPSPSQQPVNRGSSRDQVVVHEHSKRTVEPRHHTVVHKSYRPVPVEVRRVKYPYRAPVRTEIIWTIDLSRRYEVYYPHYRPYKYHYGMRLSTISAYDAYSFVGEIARVYGRVVETYYAWETDEYFLYFGDYYPYHDFSVIIPGREARDFSRRPERFFERQYVEVTGLVSRFEGKPEMIIKRSTQVAVY